MKIYSIILSVIFCIFVMIIFIIYKNNHHKNAKNHRKYDRINFQRITEFTCFTRVRFDPSNPYLWIVDKKSTNREYGGASFVDKKST